MTFGCWFVARHKVYYKGEGGRFLQVRAMVSLVNLSLPSSSHDEFCEFEFAEFEHLPSLSCDEFCEFEFAKSERLPSPGHGESCEFEFAKSGL